MSNPRSNTRPLMARPRSNIRPLMARPRSNTRPLMARPRSNTWASINAECTQKDNWHKALFKPRQRWYYKRLDLMY